MQSSIVLCVPKIKLRIAILTNHRVKKGIAHARAICAFARAIFN